MKNETMGRIALIEDDEDMSEITEAFFRQHGFQVHKFSSAEPVLRLLKENPNHHEFDVILTDMMLPEMSGIDLVQSIRENNIDVPIILVTANNDLDLAVHAIEVGAYDFILKPIPFPQLLISVRRAIRFSHMKGENEALRAVIGTKDSTGMNGVIGKSEGFRRAMDLAKKVASSQAHVLISGESGTGKEVIAKALHQLGSRRDEPFVTINCSAIPENLLESELFGHTKGAFTGANDKKIGLFEEAGNGTLFLDEIGDMSLPLQAKILRVLQERKIRRIGENQTRPVNARVVAATHKDLRAEVQERRFREDLFFRLNVIPIHLPPLRERKEDIAPLAEYFLKKYAAINGSKVKGFSRDAMAILYSNPWPGNVRELENTIERAVVLSTESVIEKKDLMDFEEMSHAGHAPNVNCNSSLVSGNLFDEVLRAEQAMKLEEITQVYIKKVLEKNGGAKEKTARELGIDRKTLYRKLSEMQNNIVTLNS